MAKETIVDIVIKNAELLKTFTSHNELREWAIKQGFDNRSAFPKFKNALYEIGMDYDKMKYGKAKEKEQEIESYIKHSLTLYSDAKASFGNYGICDKNGDVLWYGKFFSSDNASEQSDAELASAKKAVWFANQVKESLGEKALLLNLIIDAQWLTYQTHSGQKGYVLTQMANKYNIKLNVEWISGKENPADVWTTTSGYKKWQDNDLNSLVEPYNNQSEISETESENQVKDRPTFEEWFNQIKFNTVGGYILPDGTKGIGKKSNEEWFKKLYNNRFKEKKEILQGGIADNKTIEKIAKQQNIDNIFYAYAQLKKGIAVELEHTDNEEIAREIALDHLSESIDYYKELEKMEEKLKDTGNDSLNKQLIKEVEIRGEKVKIYSVDATFVRTNFNPDFNSGGHQRGWGNGEMNFIPDGEIWIDQTSDEKAKEGFIIHETIEYELMKYDKMSYEKAHEKANEKEQEYLKGETEIIKSSETSKEEEKTQSFESEGSKEGKGKLYEFFTPQIVADKMGELAYKYGFKDGGKILEPAGGNGRLIKNLSNNDITIFEINPENVAQLKTNFPKAEIFDKSFEIAFLKEPRMNQLIDNKGGTWLKKAPYDLVIANPPYGKYSGFYSSYFNFKGQFEHFFIYKSMQLLKSGGIGIYLIPSSFLRNGIDYNDVKKKIFEISKLTDAYRLPCNIFKDTQIGTDIIVLTKK